MKALKEALFSRKNINKEENVIFEFESKDNILKVSERQRYIAFELYNKNKSYTVLLGKEDVKNLIEDLVYEENSNYYISDDDNNVMLVFSAGKHTYIEFQDDESNDYDQLIIPDNKILELLDILETYLITHNIK